MSRQSDADLEIQAALTLLFNDSREFHDAPTEDEIQSGSHTDCGWCVAERLLAEIGEKP